MLRLPPVPGPSGVVSVSPCTTRTWSMSTPSSSATTWAMVVSRLWPWLAPLWATSTRPLVADADVGGVGAHPAERHRRRLGEQADADADEAPLGSRHCALLLAQVVVVDHLGRLLEVEPGRHLVERHARRHRVGHVLVVEHVAAPQLERVDARRRPRPGRSSARGPPSRTSTARGRPRGRACWSCTERAEVEQGESWYGPGNSIAVNTARRPTGARERARALEEVDPGAEQVPSSSAAMVTVAWSSPGVLVGHEVLAPVLDPLHRPAEELGWPGRCASSSGLGCIFRPKAPPTSGMITRTWLSSMPSTRAIWARTPCGPWVEIQTVSSSGRRVPAGRGSPGSPSAPSGSGAGGTSR